MPKYRYTGEPGRYYPEHGITPEPKSTHDLPRNPGDGRWETVKKTSETETDDA